MPAFERLAEINIARERAAQAEPQLLTKEPAQGCTEERACPLFVALHGNGDTAANTLVAWETVTDWGWLLAAPQSSQLLTVNSPVWNNQEIAVRDVAQHYAALQTQFNIDSERCIVAGFSMGGETALRVALSGTIPARGFVLLGPGGPTIETPDAWLPLIEQGAARGMRGYIFVGEEDTGIPQDRIRSLVELLNTHNLPCVFETLPDLRHVYPPDFAPALDRALSFIESQTDKN